MGSKSRVVQEALLFSAAVPDRLTAATSWHPHIPLAFCLVHLLQPRTIIELGTFRGDSFCAFCQAVREAGLPTRCLAIDHWKGDEHGGWYGEEVFEELSAYHDQRYGRFSRLVRAMFDEVLPTITDGSVDLLHIDGHHSYESVRHDFEAWLPKLGSRGVVLLHDTMVRERGFGVWRLWEEIKGQHVSAEVVAGHGLGIVCVGRDVPDAVVELIEELQRDEGLRHFFFDLGRSIQSAVNLSIANEALERQRSQAVEGEERLRLMEGERQLQQSRYEERILILQGALEEGCEDRERERQRMEALHRQTIEVLERSLEAERGERKAAEVKTTKMQETATQAQASREECEQLLCRREEELAWERCERKAAEAKTTKMQEAAAQAQASREECKLLLRKREEEFERIRADSVRAGEDLAGVRSELEGLHGTIRDYRSSLSWRLTAPLRLGWKVFADVGLLTHSVKRSSATTVQPPVRPASRPPSERNESAQLTLKELTTRAAMANLQVFLERRHNLTLAAAKVPIVSLIVVLYNRAELTLSCLRSVTICAPAETETIIVDNASSDTTLALLDLIHGAVVIRNSVNRYFPAAINQAVQVARGRYVLLLNNDAQLMSGAIESMLHTIQTSDDIGAVCGKIIQLDGTLQEAGSIIWKDGSCLGYGRGDDPEAPPYRFMRDVDYGSAAFLLTPRNLFLELGGFDENFSPGYYEDTDYCCRLRKHGKRVVYDPQAAIIHYEFASGFSDEMDLRRPQFVEKHADWLRGQYEPEDNNILSARCRPRKKRILIVDDRVPHTRMGSGYPRANTILRMLVNEGYAVTLYSSMTVPESWNDVYQSIPSSVEVIAGSGAGPEHIDVFWESRKDYYDVIVVSRPHNMEYVNAVLRRRPELRGRARIIYDAEAISAYRDIARKRIDGEQIGKKEANAMIERELLLGNMVDAIISVSAAEARTFLRAVRIPVHVLGHALTVVPTSRPFESRNGLLFVGAMNDDDSPNVDSILWFAEKVWPKLRPRLGRNSRLIAIGSNGSSRLRRRSFPDVDFLGCIEDIREYYDGCRIFVAPTRFAAGIPWKVCEAAAHGIPIVATSLLAMQLEWNAESDLLVADAEGVFIEQCARLYQERGLWETIRDSGLDRVRRECSEDRFRKTLIRVIDG